MYHRQVTIGVMTRTVSSLTSVKKRRKRSVEATSKNKEIEKRRKTPVNSQATLTARLTEQWQLRKHSCRLSPANSHPRLIQALWHNLALLYVGMSSIKFTASQGLHVGLIRPWSWHLIHCSHWQQLFAIRTPVCKTTEPSILFWYNSTEYKWNTFLRVPGIANAQAYFGEFNCRIWIFC